MLLKPLQNVLRSPLREVLLTEESDLALHAFGVWGVKLKSLVRGQGSATFTRTTEGSITDFEGLVQTGLAEEMRFDKARRVKNLLGSTEDFSVSPWGTTNPVEGTNTVVFLNTGDTVRQDISKSVSSGDIFGASVVLAGEGTTTLRIRNSGVFSEETDLRITLTAEEKRHFVAHTFTTTFSSIAFEVLRKTGDTAERVYVNETQLENLTSLANQNPNEYVSKGVLSGTPYYGVNVDGVAQFDYENGTTVDGNGAVTRGKGAAITDWYAPYEPAATNVIAESQDFTTGGGAWSVGAGDVETEESSVLSLLQGLNWWRLQAAAGGASTDRVINSGVHTKAAAAEYWTLTVYANKDEVDWLSINMANTPGSAGVGQYYDLANGVVGTPYETTWTYVSSDMEEITPGIYRVRLTGQTNTDTGIRARIFLAEGDGDVNITLNAGDGLYIQGAQLEKNVAPTSYIPTNGAAGTRTVDDGSGMFNLEGNLDQRKGSLVVDLRWTSNYDAVQGGTESILSLTTFPNDLLYFFSLPGDHRLTSIDGTNICKKALQFVAGKTYRIGLTWSSANGINLSWRNVTDSGTWQVWANTPFDGAYRTSGDYIRVCVPADVLAGLKRPTRIRDLRIWLQDKTTTWVEANY